jgi:phosphohistidine phosphatase
MKRLTLIRHAKSDWGTTADDFQRPLLPRGIQDAHRIGSVLCDLFQERPIVFASPAARSAATATIVAQVVSYPVEKIFFKDQLYTFSADDLISFLKTQREPNLVLFGHNPAITEFVNRFGDVRIDNVPTAGVVTISFSILEWSDLNTGQTTRIIFPKDLMDGDA